MCLHYAAVKASAHKNATWKSKTSFKKENDFPN